VSPISPPTNPDNNRGLDEVTAINRAIADETIKILEARGDYAEAALGDYIADAGMCIALPDEITPEWVHRAAEQIADEFTVWVAGGRQ
jgi:hypothetical protein